MKLVMTVVVRDEQDIIDDMLRFHLDQGVDLFLVTDNGSVDGTADILAAYVRRGLAEVWNQPANTFAQDTWVTDMARRAAAIHAADWVINNDADEFWWSRGGNLKGALDAIPALCASARVERHNFVARPGPGPWFARMTVREVTSLSKVGGPLPPKVCHRGNPGIVVGPGGHGVWEAGGEQLDANSEDMVILHFPNRGLEQFSRKVVNMGTGVATIPNQAPGDNLGARRRYALYQQGRLGDVWNELVPNDRSVARGLHDGSLVVDTRIASALGADVEALAGPTPRPAGRRWRRSPWPRV